MKVVKYYRFGKADVLQIEETSNSGPRNNEVQIEVHASTVNSGDCHMRSGKPLLARLFAGPIRPRAKVLGTTVAGRVVKIGSGVVKFKVGDRVFASLGIGSGAYSEYINVSEESTLAKLPASIGYEEAASLIFGGLSAKYFLDKAGIKKDKKILINGASGGVGSYAVQLAHYHQAQVTGVCSNKSLEFVTSLGSDHVIDYKNRNLDSLDESYDIILDTVGNIPMKSVEKLLNPSGVYITTVAKLALFLKDLGKKQGKRYLFDVTKSSGSDLEFVADLVVKGHFKALIDQVYVLEDVVRAHEHVESQSKRGAVVLSMQHKAM